MRPSQKGTWNVVLDTETKNEKHNYGQHNESKANREEGRERSKFRLMFIYAAVDIN